MLRGRNSHVARATLTPARLTMKHEMATLYSRFAARPTLLQLAKAHRQPEGTRRINRLFCDVLRHFSNGTVAKRRHSLTGTLVLCASLVGGCASMTGGSGLGPETTADVKRDAVTARAKARWDALIKPDLASAYTFLRPASRATMSFDQYKAKHKVGMYRAVTIDSVDCEAERCTVNLKLTYDYQRFKGMVTPLSERWIITQGQAWFVEPG
jgi:hypothetical protein